MMVGLIKKLKLFSFHRVFRKKNRDFNDFTLLWKKFGLKGLKSTRFIVNAFLEKVEKTPRALSASKESLA